MYMNNIQKRFVLFIFGCIGARTLLMLLAKNIPIQYLPYMGYLTIFPVIGFMYIYITGSRNTGAEVFGEKIWWNDLRPLHAALYGLFAYNAINGHRSAWKFLLADIVIGLSAFLYHHWSCGSFQKLL